jgi:hypothetical protein
MKLFNQILTGLLLVAGLANPLYADTASPDAKEAVRYLLLAEKDDGGGNSCKIAITKSITIDFTDEGETDCKNDELSYYQLDNVQSATRILFKNDKCKGSPDHSWEFLIRTYIQPISTPWLSLADLRGRSEGDYVSRGILLERTNDNDEQIKGKLTCVVITVSPSG